MEKMFDSVLVEKVVEGLSAMGIDEVCNDKDLLDCTIEQIRKIKKSVTDSIKAVETAKREEAKAEAFAKGKNLAKSAKIGDTVVAIIGSGKFAKEYSFPIQKIGENTITVEYTEDNSPNGETGKRYINYAKVVNIIAA